MIRTNWSRDIRRLFIWQLAPEQNQSLEIILERTPADKTSKSLNVNVAAGNSYNPWEQSLGTGNSHWEAFVDTFPGIFPRRWWIPEQPGVMAPGRGELQLNQG